MSHRLRRVARAGARDAPDRVGDRANNHEAHPRHRDRIRGNAIAHPAGHRRAADCGRVLRLRQGRGEGGDLAHLRKEICARNCTEKPYKVVEISSPQRGSTGSYEAGVAAWHAERAELAAHAIREHLADNRTGAFLVWGDPALYDSTLRILETIKSSAMFDFEYDVIPGISSIQVLGARHKIALNTVGEPVLVTTGRKLAQSFPAGQASIAVFLDNGDGLRSPAGRPTSIGGHISGLTTRFSLPARSTMCWIAFWSCVPNAAASRGGFSTSTLFAPWLSRCRVRARHALDELRRA